MNKKMKEYNKRKEMNRKNAIIQDKNGNVLGTITRRKRKERR